MKCLIKYILCGIAALCLGIMCALLFPIELVAGVEAIVIISLSIWMCFKK